MKQRPRPIGFGSPESASIALRPTRSDRSEKLPEAPRDYIWHATSMTRISVSYRRALELHAIHERVSPNPLYNRRKYTR